MSPQRSNRDLLIEGTLACLDRQPAGSITARDIAAASGANLASINYHFASKDALIAHALTEGLGRWFAELAAEVGDLHDVAPGERIDRAVAAMLATASNQQGLARAFLNALSLAPYSPDVRRVVADSYAGTRTAVAALLGLGDDDDALAAASIAIAVVDGLLIQSVVSDDSDQLAFAVKAGIARLLELTSGR